MESLNTFLVLLTGLVIRLALPIAVTVGFIAVLRRLDARWQFEAEQSARQPIEKLKCWQIKNCSPAEREACQVRNAAEPCWQERRLSNGYLAEECLDCDVFVQAPVPAGAAQ